MEFPKDEVKNKISWTKGADITEEVQHEKSKYHSHL